MKALVISSLGSPEVLQVRGVPEPAPTLGETLVRVEAAGLNFADILTAKGGYPGTPKPPLTAGREFAGTIPGSGDRVMGYAQWGAFAQFTCARPHLLWPIPDAWTFEEGAAFPVNYFTAYFAYWKAGLTQLSSNAPNIPGTKKPSRVLIHAVAGGVGTAAVQIGKILGVEMYGTSSSDEKLAKMQALGLQHPINYQRHDYEDAIRQMTNGEGVDVVFEMLGGENVAKSVRCLRDFGRVMVYGSATGHPGQLDTRMLYAKATSVHGLWLTYLSNNHDLMSEAWKQLSTWISRDQLKPVIGSVLPLERAVEAYHMLSDRKNFGKVILRIS
jgi:NADPH2:quinone reductase